MTVTLAATPGIEELERAPVEPVKLSQADLEKAQSYLTRMWETLDSLQTGDVTVTEKEAIAGQDNTYHFREWFSHPQDLVRYDVMRSRRPNRTSFVRTAEERLLVFWSQRDSPTTVVRLPREGPLSYDRTDPVDFRTLGVANGPIYRSRLPLAWIQERVKLNGPKTTGTLSVIDESTEPYIDLIWVGESSQKFKTLLRLDASQGYTPILRVHVRSDGKQYHLKSHSETTWEKKNKTWIPVRVHIENINLTFSHDLKLDWKSVNEKLPPHTFTMEGLELPKGTTITNEKTKGQSFHEGTVGD
ncbi:hypothetical protein [Blastopirellula marina]|nr:hypothetical protein [Blastopirellula marina]